MYPENVFARHYVLKKGEMSSRWDSMSVKEAQRKRTTGGQLAGTPVNMTECPRVDIDAWSTTKHRR
jgi:hypothetical protein